MPAAPPLLLEADNMRRRRSDGKKTLVLHLKLWRWLTLWRDWDRGKARSLPQAQEEARGGRRRRSPSPSQRTTTPDPDRVLRRGGSEQEEEERARAREPATTYRLRPVRRPSRSYPSLPARPITALQIRPKVLRSRSSDLPPNGPDRPSSVNRIPFTYADGSVSRRTETASVSVWSDSGNSNFAREVRRAIAFRWMAVRHSTVSVARAPDDDITAVNNPPLSYPWGGNFLPG